MKYVVGAALGEELGSNDGCILVGLSDGARDTDGAILGRLLGVSEGCIEKVGLTDGEEEGRAETVGFAEILGANDGSDEGQDDTVGLRLMEGVDVGRSVEGEYDGELDIDGASVGALVERPCC